MAPRKRAAPSKTPAAPAEPMETETEDISSEDGKGSKAVKKTKKVASKEASSPQTNGHSSSETSPPAKRSKRMEPDSEARTSNGDTKGSKKKNASKTPETILEDEELNTGNKLCNNFFINIGGLPFSPCL